MRVPHRWPSGADLCQLVGVAVAFTLEQSWQASKDMQSYQIKPTCPSNCPTNNPKGEVDMPDGCGKPEQASMSHQTPTHATSVPQTTPGR